MLIIINYKNIIIYNNIYNQFWYQSWRHGPQFKIIIISLIVFRVTDCLCYGRMRRENLKLVIVMDSWVMVHPAFNDLTAVCLVE